MDVGGGIGSTSMLLAAAFSPPNEDPGLKFIVQDREPVTAMGEKVGICFKVLSLPFIDVNSIC